MMTYTLEWTRRNGTLARLPCNTFMEAYDKRNTLLRIGLPATVHIEDVGRGDPSELPHAAVAWPPERAT